ncbi:MAG: hypothetical protein Tsb004_15140 [Allomuricauda sp.]
MIKSTGKYEHQYHNTLSAKKNLKQMIHMCGLHALYEKAEYNAEFKAEQLYKPLFSSDPSLYALVVEKGSNLVGYATYMKQSSTWEASHYIYMDCLFILNEFRGLGIGEHMVNRIKEEGRKLGCLQIQWQTPAFNIGAIRFYHRIGAKSKSKERFFLTV